MLLFKKYGDNIGYRVLYYKINRNRSRDEAKDTIYIISISFNGDDVCHQQEFQTR